MLKLAESRNKEAAANDEVSYVACRRPVLCLWLGGDGWFIVFVIGLEHYSFWDLTLADELG